MAGVLHQRDFRLLLAGQFVSDFGAALGVFALPTISIFSLHANAYEVSALTGAEYAVVPLFAMLAGVLVDRWRRRRTMVAANLVRTVAVGTLPVACALHALTLPLLFAIALIAALSSLFFDTAYQPFLAGLVGRTQYKRANATMTAGAVAARAFANALCGPLIALTGPAAALVANACTYVCGTGALSAIRRSEPLRAVPVTRLRDDFKQGVALLARDRVLGGLACVTTAYYFAGAMIDAILPLYAYRVLHLSPAAFGLTLAIANLGILAGALVPQAVKRLGMWQTLAAMLVFIAVGDAVCFAAFLPVAALMIGRFIVGAAAPAYEVIAQTIATERVDDRMLGRMNASMRTLTNAAIPLGCISGGALFATLGCAGTLAVSCAGFGLAIAIHATLAKFAGITERACSNPATKKSQLQLAA